MEIDRSALERKYAKVFASIQNESECNRDKAKERFLLVKEFSIFEKAAIGEAEGKLSHRQAILAFCATKGINEYPFTNWIFICKSKGIKGLLSKFGSRKGSSPYVTGILPILSEILEPNDHIRQTYSKLSLICTQLDIKCPSIKTVMRMLEASGLISRKHKRTVVTTVKTELEVDILHPLACLQQLADFISGSELFSATMKKHVQKSLQLITYTESRIKSLSLAKPLTLEEIDRLKKYKASNHRIRSMKAAAILMVNKNPTLAEVVRLTGRHPGTVFQWIKRFDSDRFGLIEVKSPRPARQKHIEQRTDKLIEIIHTPPASYGVNRTTWNYASIAMVYLNLYQDKISVKTVGRVVRKSGYCWRHARRVLTSPDPEYMAKVEKVLDTLKGLKEGEQFYFIDEVGPYRVKKYGGFALRAKSDTETEPVNQASRGKVQFVAALEAVSNQLTWIFTDNKKASSIVALIEALARNNASCPTFYLTWDAISAHSSKEVMGWIGDHNSTGKVPHIEVVPLPSKSQFLNVIEAVFGGMKKAVICNSDYATRHEMENAIACHFVDRNKYFVENPKRAGNKIWDKQSFDFDKLAGGLFRRM
jgi:transposase